MMNKKFFIFLLVLVLIIPTGFIYSRSFLAIKLIPTISTGMVVVPDTSLERLCLSAASDTWIQDGARRSNDFIEYKFEIFRDFPVILELDAAGPYIIDVSMGGGEFSSIYSSGQLDGNLSGRMKRQIRVDIKPENPMRIRVKRRESASAPFTLWRLNVHRMHEIFPGSEIEQDLLVKTGSSTLPQGGGRLIPANSEISYSVSHAADTWVTFFIDVDKKINAKIDDELLELNEVSGKYWVSKKIVEGDNTFSIAASEDTKLRSFSMVYGFTPVDVNSDLGIALADGKRGKLGVELSDEPTRIFIPGEHKFFWCTSTYPESVSIFGLDKKSLGSLIYFDIGDSPEYLNITGEGEILTFSFDEDNDEDGLPTHLELLTGTNSYLLRTDNDDQNDGLDDRPLDTDNDGLDDHVETFLMLSTKYPDTDSDGYYDGLGLEGFEWNNFCARVTDKPWIGAQYIDTENRAIIPECQRFGKTSMVIPFHDVLLGYKPSDTLIDMFEAAGDCDGFLLDTCAISTTDFKESPELVDEYQIWGKRLWTDIDTDDGLAFTLHNFATDRIGEALNIARAYTDKFEIELAVSIPSPSAFSEWLLPYDGFDIVDRIIVIPPSFAGDNQMYMAGLFDAKFIGKPFYVEVTDEAKSRAYISGVRDAGFFLGTFVSDRRPLVVGSGSQKASSTFVQVVNESTIWSKRLDKNNIHQNWQMSFASKEFDLLPCRFDELGDAEVGILDMGTTFVSQEDIQSLKAWVKSGGNLLIYDNPTRFKDFMWWNKNTSLGEILAKDLGVIAVQVDKTMKTGDGHLFITKNDPMFSLDLFKVEAGFEIPILGSSYDQITEFVLEADFAKSTMKNAGEYPKKQYPIHIKPDMGKTPYLVSSTCAVPWVDEWNKKLRVIAQAPKGICSSFSLAVAGKPKSVTSTVPIKWFYKNGILQVAFVSTGSNGFVISTDEGIDLASINLNMQPRNPEENSICTVLATVYNPTGIPSGEYSVYFYWDELKRENLFKTVVGSSIAPSGYEYMNFSAPIYLTPGKHKLYMHIKISDEVNVTNNTKVYEFEVTKIPTFKTITLKIDSNDAFVNGVLSVLDSPPVIVNGRTMVPFRFLAENLGAKVEWNDYEKRVAFIKDDTLMYLWIGKSSAIVNSKMVELDAAPVIRNGRTLVPLRVISENLGAEVSWDGNTRTVQIKMEIEQGER